MTNYIEQRNRIKENISRFRDFSDQSRDGISPERVVFTNNDNIFYGVFAGQISGDGSTFNDCVVNHGTICNSELCNVTFVDGAGEPITPSGIMMSMSEISTTLGEDKRQVQQYQLSTNASLSGLSTARDELSGEVLALSSRLAEAISAENEIYVDGKKASSLSVVHVSQDEYQKKLSSNNIASNEVYVVLSTYPNAYGKKIVNVSAPSISSDAATKGYVDGNFYARSQTSSATQIKDALVSIVVPTDLSAFTNSPGYITQHQSLSNYYTKSETSSSEQLANELMKKLEANDVQLRYDNIAHKILLSSMSYVTSVDCADFIKDGMLSSVELCGTILVLKFNTDAGSSPISVQMSSFVDNYDSKISSLSTSIDTVSSSIPTKVSQLQNDSGYTTNVGTITGITMNGVSKGTSGVVNLGTVLTAHQSLTNYYNKTETSSSIQLANALSGKLAPDEVSISYNSAAKKILLTSRTNVTSVDCADFIKDGMLSSAELCGTTLVLKFNTDAGSSPISVQLSNFVDNYDSKISSLSTAIDDKVYIDGLSSRSLSVTHIGRNEFYQKVVDDALLSNEIYIVSGDYINAYDQQIKNIAPGVDLSDAVNVEQLNTVSSSIPTKVSQLTNDSGYTTNVGTITGVTMNGISKGVSGVVDLGTVLTAHQSLSNYYQMSETSSATQILSALSTKAGLNDLLWKETGDDAITQTQTSKTPIVSYQENTAISKSSIVVGNSNIAGLRGYKYSNFGNTTSSLSFDTAPSGWAIGDVVSIVNQAKYPDCATIASISGTTVVFSEDLSNIISSIIEDSGWDAKVAYISEKPNAGDIEIGYCAYAEGVGTKALNAAAHAEGRETRAYGQYSHAEGKKTYAQYAAHAEGCETSALTEQAHAEGYQTVASGKHSHSEGSKTNASGPCAHAEGELTNASGNHSHAEGYSTIASKSQAHAEGNNTQATENQAHAEGNSTTASGKQSHAEGFSTIASGGHAHAEGAYTKAIGGNSHAAGISAIAQHNNTFAWNGVSNELYSTTSAGTFNINPVGGLSGFYVGQQTLANALDSKRGKDDLSYGVNDWLVTSPISFRLVKDSSNPNIWIGSAGDVQYGLLYIPDNSEWQFRSMSSSAYAQQTAPADATNLQFTLDDITYTLETVASDSIALSSSVSNKLDKSDLPYSFIELTATSNQIVDHAMNSITSPSGNVQLILPSKNPNGARKFIVRIDLVDAGTLPAISFVASSGETITFETATGTWPSNEFGKVAIYEFVETTSGVFSVSHALMSKITSS